MDLRRARRRSVGQQGHAITQAQAVEQGGAQAEGQLRAGHGQVRDPLAAQDQVELREHERAEAFFDDAVLALDGFESWRDARSGGAGHYHGPGPQSFQARNFDVGSVAAIFAHDMKDRQPKVPK